MTAQVKDPLPNGSYCSSYPVQKLFLTLQVVLNDELDVVLHIVGVGADVVGQHTHFHGAVSTTRKDVIAWCRLDLHDACA